MRLDSAAYGARSRVCARTGWPTSHTLMRSRESKAKFRNAGKSRKNSMDAPECVRNYKSLAQVERAFRSLKTVDLKVRPIHHRKPDRVRAHIFLCMLAYYVEWHMREAWRELMFADTDQQAKTTRDPVAPAKRSKAAQAKAASHTLDNGTPAHSFSTLLADLAGIVRNTRRAPNAALDVPTFQVITTPSAKQHQAFELLRKIRL